MSALWRRKRLAEATASWSEADFVRALRHWPLLCRPEQRVPGLCRRRDPWTIWLMLGGRGAGKTRTGAEWVRGIALGEPDFAEPALRRIALVGETFADARNVMIEGPAGILSLHERAANGRHGRLRCASSNGRTAQSRMSFGDSDIGFQSSPPSSSIGRPALAPPGSSSSSSAFSRSN